MLLTPEVYLTWVQMKWWDWWLWLIVDNFIEIIKWIKSGDFTNQAMIFFFPSSSAATSSDWLPSWKPSYWRWHISVDRSCTDRKQQALMEWAHAAANADFLLVRTSYLLIFVLFLHPSPPSQWLLRVPLVIMLPQVTQGFPLPYGCNNRSINKASIFTFYTLISCIVLAVSARLILVVNVLQVPVEIHIQLFPSMTGIIRHMLPTC